MTTVIKSCFVKLVVAGLSVLLLAAGGLYWPADAVPSPCDPRDFTCWLERIAQWVKSVSPYLLHEPLDAIAAIALDADENTACLMMAITRQRATKYETEEVDGELVKNPDMYYAKRDAFSEVIRLLEPFCAPTRPPSVPPATVIRSLPITPGAALDPNDKFGAAGIETARYVSERESLRYRVLFANVESATLPAQEVTITDALDVARL